MAAIWASLITLAVLLALFELPLTVKVSGQADEEGVRIATRLHLLGILVFHHTYRYDWQHSSDRHITQPRVPPRARFLVSYQMLASIMKISTIAEWDLQLDVGFEDAALTGWITGIAYLAAGIVNRWLIGKVRFQSAPSTVVTPHFNQLIGRLSLRCIVKSRLGKATYAAIRLLILLRRRDAHGRPSNSVPDVHHA